MVKIDKRLKLIYKLRRQNIEAAAIELNSICNVNTSLLFNYKEKKLGELLYYLIRNTRYYSRFSDEIKRYGESPTEILKSLNSIDKSIITNNYSDFLNRNLSSSLRSTSGTTGSPFKFHKDNFASTYMDAMMYIAYNWHGIESLDPQARLWGRSLSHSDKIIQIFKDIILKRRRLSSFAMNDLNCKSFFNRLQNFNPKYFYCYPNALYQFGVSLVKQGIDAKKLGISVAICTGEVLFPHQRQELEGIFGCKVVNEYGSTENGIIAFECEHSNLHVMPTVIVDILNPNSEGYGEIAITELNSRSIPFLKYKTGDIGRIINKDCPCKRPFEIIEIREGRIDDFIICPNGNMVYDAILAYTLKDFAVHFKAVQERLDLLEIRIVPKNNLKLNVKDHISHRLQKYLGNEIQIKIYIVTNIQPDESGKLRYFKSKIRP
jgi:phenylacetate-CoA ligase